MCAAAVTKHLRLFASTQLDIIPQFLFLFDVAFDFLYLFIYFVNKALNKIVLIVLNTRRNRRPICSRYRSLCNFRFICGSIFLYGAFVTGA